MLDISNEELKKLVGNDSLKVFDSICEYIDNNYEMESSWDNGGKRWTYEYKFRKGGKTLCAFYFKENCLGFMIIFGKNEREKIENTKEKYSNELIELYNNTTTYHDGKWLMLELEDFHYLEDIKRLLLIKRKPNKK